MSTESEIRKTVCDQVERGLTDLLERLSNILGPQSSPTLFGVSAGMIKLLGEVRKGKIDAARK